MQRLVIEPSGKWTALKLGDLWEYRELIYFLVWRDIKIRYRQTFLGVTWVILQPLLTAAVFSIFFGRWAGMPSEGHPYPVFAYCALIPWQLFARALSEASVSLVTNQQLITKVYFPRLVIPISAVAGGLLDFVISFSALLALMIVYGIPPTTTLLALPLFILLLIGVSLGASLWLCALNVQYRDVRYAVPFLAQLWFFLTPVVYPSSLVPEVLRPVLGLNPMAGVVDGFRWSLLGGSMPHPQMFVVSLLSAVCLLVGGLIYFRLMEKSFADII